MKKVNATAIFERIALTMDRDTTNYRLKSVYIKTNSGDIIPLFTQYWNQENLTFKEMYDKVLALLRNNNFYVKRWSDFRSIWYDVDWIDIDYPCYPSHYSYRD